MSRQDGQCLTRSDLDALFRNQRLGLERYLVRRLKSADLASEIAQEAFLRLVRQQGTTPSDSPPIRHLRAYLFQTARHLVADHYRSRQPVADASLEVALETVDPTPDAEAVVQAREELAVLRAAVDALPPRGREIFLLHKFEGLSYAQIAQRLGISPNTVMVHMMRSLAACSARLESYRRDHALAE